ncbi:MAG: lipopolysaccharide core heptose(I) kinase RfaP [Pseudomonadota bacterium]
MPVNAEPANSEPDGAPEASVDDVWLREDVASALDGRAPFAVLPALPGVDARAVARRRTTRVELAGKAFYLKLHGGVGWGELFKNWLTFKAPVVSARNEFDACRSLAQLGIRAPVVAAFAARGRSPADIESFVLTDEITGHTTLEDLADTRPLTGLERHRLVTAVADFTRAFHGAGFIHRDYYICHLWLEDGTLADKPALTVIDLHRARRFARIPNRYLVRDLGALLFSVPPAQLTLRSQLRFLRRYRQRPLREILREEGALWRAVRDRAATLARR